MYVYLSRNIKMFQFIPAYPNRDSIWILHNLNPVDFIRIKQTKAALHSLFRDL